MRAEPRPASMKPAMISWPPRDSRPRAKATIAELGTATADAMSASGYMLREGDRNDRDDPCRRERCKCPLLWDEDNGTGQLAGAEAPECLVGLIERHSFDCRLNGAAGGEIQELRGILACEVCY